MRTSTIEVPDMLAVMTVDDVERRFGEVPGVASATVNFAAGQVTVRYDETLLKVSDIRVMVHQRGEGLPVDTGPADAGATSRAVEKPAAPPTPGVKTAAPPTPPAVPTSPPPTAETHAGNHAAAPGADAHADHVGAKAGAGVPNAPPGK